MILVKLGIDDALDHLTVVPLPCVEKHVHRVAGEGGVDLVPALKLILGLLPLLGLTGGARSHAGGLRAEHFVHRGDGRNQTPGHRGCRALDKGGAGGELEVRPTRHNHVVDGRVLGLSGEESVGLVVGFIHQLAPQLIEGTGGGEQVEGVAPDAVQVAIGADAEKVGIDELGHAAVLTFLLIEELGVVGVEQVVHDVVADRAVHFFDEPVDRLNDDVGVARVESVILPHGLHGLGRLRFERFGLGVDAGPANRFFVPPGKPACLGIFDLGEKVGR